MPYVNIKVTPENLTAEKKQKLIKGVTTLLQTELNKNPSTTIVIIDEVETDNWGIAGGECDPYKKSASMSGMAHVGLFALVFVAGLGIPMMAAMSGQLALQMGMSRGLFVVFSMAFAISGLYLIYSMIRTPSAVAYIVDWESFNPVLFAAGAIVVFYMLAVSIVGPKIGIANTIVVVLLGQIVSALVIDHFGLFNYSRVPISAEKIMGVICMVVGIYLTRK